MSRVPGFLPMPKIGLGTLKIPKRDVEGVICKAIRLGYKLFDCAPTYRNQLEIGRAIHSLIETQEIQRSDLFLISKVFNTHHVYNGEDRPRESLLSTLKDLQVQHLDLLLMHWPHGFPEKNPGKIRDKSGRPHPNLLVEEEYLGTWKSMIKLQEEGLVKHIGVSNFKIEQIERIIEAGLSIPAANEVELNLYLQQPELVDYCKKRRIQLIAYSPLGPKRQKVRAASARAEEPRQHNIARLKSMALLDDPDVAKIAKEVGMTPPQILLQWCLQKGFVSIPMSANSQHLEENLIVAAAVDSAKFDATVMASLTSLDKCRRTSTGFLQGHF